MLGLSREAVLAIEAASCVVHLNNAEQRGVPLPAGWGPKVAALLDGSAQAAGTLRGLGLLLELVALLYRKYELASPGAPADHQEGAAKIDPELLRRRAEATAEAAALRYHESCDGRVQAFSF